MQETARQKESDMLMKIAGQEERKKVAAEEGRKRRSEEDEITSLKEEEVLIIYKKNYSAIPTASLHMAMYNIIRIKVNNYVATVTLTYISYKRSQRKPTVFLRILQFKCLFKDINSL